MNADPEEEAFFTYGIDLGVASAVLALNAAGCVTTTSCRGGPGHQVAHPLIRVWADRLRGEILTNAARAAGCGLRVDEEGHATIEAPSVTETIGLGAALLERRLLFEALPPISAESTLLSSTAQASEVKG